MSRRLHIADEVPGFPVESMHRTMETHRTYCGRLSLDVTYWAAPNLVDNDDFLRHRERCGACLRAQAARVRRRALARRARALTEAGLPHA